MIAQGEDAGEVLGVEQVVLLDKGPDQCWPLGDFGHLLGRQGHGVGYGSGVAWKLVEARDRALVLEAHAEVAPGLGRHGLRHGHDVLELCLPGGGDGAAVDVDDVIDYHESLAGEADGTLDVVLASVYGAPLELSVAPGVLEDIPAGIGDAVAAQACADLVIVALGQVDAGDDGVALGVVEDDDVTALDAADARQAMVVELRVGEVALGVDDGQGVLRQREVKRRLRHARPVNGLVDPQVVAH